MSPLNFVKKALVGIFIVLWYFYGLAVVVVMAREGFSFWLGFVGILLMVVNILAFVFMLAPYKTNILIKAALVGDILILVYAFAVLPISEYSGSIIFVGATIAYFLVCLVLRPSKSGTKAT